MGRLVSLVFRFFPYESDLKNEKTHSIKAKLSSNLLEVKKLDCLGKIVTMLMIYEAYNYVEIVAESIPFWNSSQTRKYRNHE